MGTKVVAIVVMISAVLGIIGNILQAVWYGYNVLAILFISAGVMLYGVVKSKKFLLIPYIIFQVNTKNVNIMY
jgi:hypothetical protein